ncbi:MAG: hypothetical protein ACOC32_04360 [Nanoarchaeota archaeon]
MRRIVLALILIAASVFLSGCAEEENVTIKPSPSIVLRCTGETSAVVSDYCIVEDNRTMKFLITNRYITTLKHVNIDLTGTRGTFSTRGMLEIEMDEQRIVEFQYDDIGRLQEVSVHVFYFGNSGLEACVPEDVNISAMRRCGESAP